MPVVDDIYSEYKATRAILERSEELSLLVSLESSYKKTLLLAAASYFEMRLSSAVEEFAKSAGRRGMIGELVKKRVITRQYHTWFDWDKRNANKFFSMFGPLFLVHMKEYVESNKAIDDSIRLFLEIGEDRNRIVHENFGSAVVDKTTEEIYKSYGKALPFVDCVGEQLAACASTSDS